MCFYSLDVCFVFIKWTYLTIKNVNSCTYVLHKNNTKIEPRKGFFLWMLTWHGMSFIISLLLIWFYWLLTLRINKFVKKMKGHCIEVIKVTSMYRNIFSVLFCYHSWSYQKLSNFELIFFWTSFDLVLVLLQCWI